MFPFRERVVGMVAVASGMLAFGLSFTITHANGRPILFAFSLLMCLVSLLISKYKLQVIGAFFSFLVLRVVITIVLRPPW